MIAAVVSYVHILEYRHGQSGQLGLAIISFRMGYKMLTRENSKSNSNVVLNVMSLILQNLSAYHKSL